MIGGAAQNNLVAAIADNCRAGLGLDELRQRVLPRLRRAMPIDALWWAAADPALWRATERTPERSARYRDIFEPLGLGDELRAVLRADGACWGYLCLHREGPNDFSEQEEAFIERIAPHLADGFRLATLVGKTQVQDAAPPGVVVLAEDGTRSSTNTAGERWLEELGPDCDRNELPLEVLAVAARPHGVDGTDARSPRLHVRTRAGRWAVLHASWLGEPPSRTVAVIIEQPTPGEVLPLLLPAYGLTPQERRVTGLVCRGSSTLQIAAELHVTANTVQDRLKSIFTKTGVHSRRDLVATLLKQQYH